MKKSTIRNIILFSIGAAKLHLRILDLPVHYQERVSGETKMTGRLRNGLIMLRMCWAAFLKLKLY